MAIALLTGGLGAGSRRAALLTAGLGAIVPTVLPPVAVTSTALVVSLLVTALQTNLPNLELMAGAIRSQVEVVMAQEFTLLAAAAENEVEATTGLLDLTAFATIQEVTVVLKFKQRENLRYAEFLLTETPIPTIENPTPKPVPANLTNASTAKVFYALVKAGATRQKDLTFLSPRTNGKVSCTFLAADLAPGDYKLEIAVTFAGGEVRYYPTEGHYRMKVEESMGV